MVSKVAVIALVAIVACPILLGYAMNLSETTVTDYKITDDTVNVTQLLQNDVTYSQVYADTYILNSNFSCKSGSLSDSRMVPIYEEVTPAKSAIPMEKYDPLLAVPWSRPASEMYWYYYQSNYQGGGTYLNLNVTDLSNNTVLTVNCINSVYYDHDTLTFYYTYYPNPNNTSVLSSSSTTFPTDQYNIGFTQTGSDTIPDAYMERSMNNGNTTNAVNISAGFHFENVVTDSLINLPTHTKTFLMTIDLDSITDANYSTELLIESDFGPTLATYELAKTTVGSEVTWIWSNHNGVNPVELYYNPSGGNVYQFYCDITDRVPQGSMERVNLKCEMRYVGSWPTLMGEANYFLKYTKTGGAIVQPSMVNGIESINFRNTDHTPILRMDRAFIDGFEVPIIANQVYDPASFKTNPSTTISSISFFGSSLEFGGNTYTVTNGNVTMGLHEVSVNNMKLESVPVVGGYENRINGVAVSTTANPSTIKFNGNWSASISTTSMESSTYTKTEWTPGQFGWDGIDQNFLMVGLLTSIGVFIALGIYMRRTKAALWPLLVVCGGAAVLFFIML